MHDSVFTAAQIYAVLRVFRVSRAAAEDGYFGQSSEMCRTGQGPFCSGGGSVHVRCISLQRFDQQQIVQLLYTLKCSQGQVCSPLLGKTRASEASVMQVQVPSTAEEPSARQRILLWMKTASSLRKEAAAAERALLSCFSSLQRCEGKSIVRGSLTVPV